MAGPRASNLLNPDRDRIFQFSEIKNFPNRGATTRAANEFDYMALANLHALTASSSAMCLNEAACQAYLKRDLVRQGAISRKWFELSTLGAYASSHKILSY